MPGRCRSTAGSFASAGTRTTTSGCRIRAVHRYHAVIERTPDEAFVITDLSGKDGNGVRVNGERQSRAQLADGDVIELGRTRLKFESAQA